MNSVISEDDIRVRFTHSFWPSQENNEKSAHLRKRCADLANEILRQTKPGREQSLALTKLEEVMLWSCASIARNP